MPKPLLPPLWPAAPPVARFCADALSALLLAAGSSAGGRAAYRFARRLPGEPLAHLRARRGWRDAAPAMGSKQRARVAVAACWLPIVLWACAAPAPTASAAVSPVTRSVHVVNHGWHTGLVLRGDDVPAAVWPAKADFQGAVHLEVGWGDSAYYRAAEPSAWLALKAVAWPTPGVLHVAMIDGPVERFFADAEVIEIGVSEPGLQRLLEHLRDSHELDAAGRPIALGPGLYGHGRFYASRERFHLFKTCNVWVATALQAAGVPVMPALAITSGRLMAQLRQLARVPENGQPDTAPPHAIANTRERP